MSTYHKDQVRLIDVYFGIIIAIGLERFARFLFTNSIETTFEDINFALNIIFFFSAFFFLISDWISYHIYAKNHEYESWRRFGLDVIIVSVMFFILFTSLSGFTNSVYFITSLLAWYSLICGWWINRYLTNKPDRCDSKKNILLNGIMISLLLGILLTIVFIPKDFLSIGWSLVNIENILKFSIIVVISSYSIFRLTNSIKNDEDWLY